MEINERSIFEIAFKNGELKEAEGLGAAFLLNTVALSFLSADAWDTPIIKQLKQYSRQEDGSTGIETVHVRHAANPDHIENHTGWIEKKRRESLKAGKELWRRRKEFFPHLILCGQIEQQLTLKYGIQSKYFNQIIDRLRKLDAFAEKWSSGKFSDKTLLQYGLTVSGESKQTIVKYGRERRFRLPDGEKELFEKHIKTGDLRFHFYPDEKTHRIYVGYIGPHLRTVTN
jgi:hypothetical protein